MGHTFQTLVSTQKRQRIQVNQTQSSAFGELDSHARITQAQFARLLGVGKTKFYKMIASLPKPIRYGRSVRWVYHEVLAYLRRQEDARE
jgi:predicted DNA-binding transcriptional regulator AlpA